MKKTLLEKALDKIEKFVVEEDAVVYGYTEQEKEYAKKIVEIFRTKDTESNHAEHRPIF